MDRGALAGYTVHGVAKSCIPSKFFQHEINQPQCGMSLRPPNANLCPSVTRDTFLPRVVLGRGGGEWSDHLQDEEEEGV